MKKIINNIFSFFDFDYSKKLKTKKQIIFICDHASNKIPKKYENLGLQTENILSHIAWDIGAKLISLKLAKEMKACCFLSNFSRLIIDPNRELKDKDLIARNSFGVNIPGNKKISNIEKVQRLKSFHNKYHEGLSSIIEKKKLIKRELVLFSIHSFTKKSLFFDRPNEIGLLWNKDMSIAIPLYKELNKLNINVGNNFPYPGFYFNYTLDRHSLNGEIKNLSIEIRNDLICNRKGINKWGSILIRSLKTILQKDNYE